MALFGITPKKEPAAPADPNAVIFDVSTEGFELRVLQASMTKPVIVDFWAPWCGPCKQLMPILESEVNAAKGSVLLAKVNIDENGELAQALRIQSVPTIMAFFQGQPVTAFAGARPASEIRKLIVELVKLAGGVEPDALDIPKALAEAAQLTAQGDVQFAQEIYQRILQQDPKNIDAHVGIVRSMVSAGVIEHAEYYLNQIPEDISKHPNFASVKTALEIAKGKDAASAKLKPLLQKSEKNPDDHQAKFDLAQAQFAAGYREDAIANLLAIMGKDRAWNDEAARKELLRYFEALGFTDPLAIEGRKKLSRLLFS